VASFDLIRHHRTDERVFLYAFDLIELNGDDRRRDPLEIRKATLRSILAKAGLGLRFNEHLEGRIQAEQADNTLSQEMLLRIAEDFERLAEHEFALQQARKQA